MKILIAYDGSEPAKSAIEALQHAGLPAQGVQAMVLTAAEPHAMIGSAKMEPAINIDPNLPIVTYAMERSQESVVYAEEMAENDAEEGAQAVTRLFPSDEHGAYWEPGLRNPLRSEARACRYDLHGVARPLPHGTNAIGKRGAGGRRSCRRNRGNCAVRKIRHYCSNAIHKPNPAKMMG